MLKRKVRILVGICFSVLVLASCGKSAKEEFIQQFGKQTEQKIGIWDFSMEVSEVEFSKIDDSQKNQVVSAMMATKIKDMSLSGKLKKDSEKFDYDIKINAIGMEVPIHLLGSFDKEPKLYFAADTLKSISSIANIMSEGEVDTSQVDFQKLKGKYIDILTVNETGKVDWSKSMKDYQQSAKERKKEYQDYLNSLEKDSFTKKGDTLTHTFTSKELQDIVNIKSNKNVKKLLKNLKEISAKVSINTKTNSIDTLVKVTPNQENQKI